MGAKVTDFGNYIPPLENFQEQKRHGFGINWQKSGFNTATANDTLRRRRASFQVVGTLMHHSVAGNEEV